MIGNGYSRAAKHQNRSVLEESMKLCTMGLWYLRIIKKNGPQKFAPPGGRHIEFKYGRQNHNIFAHICCSIAPRTKIQVSIPMFSMSGNILAMSEFMSEARHIGSQDGRHIIKHAFFHDRLMSRTMSLRKLLYQYMGISSISISFRWQPYSISR